MNDILEINTKALKIAVYGDLMLDRYYYGNVQRVSPEAPVPVVNVVKESSVPGGAANVINNLLKLGCKVVPFGLIGDDLYGGELIHQLKLNSVDNTMNVDGIIVGLNCKTIVKERVIGNSQQVVRLDFNDKIEYSLTDEQNLKEAIAKSIDGCNMFIISDYNKGACTENMCKFIIKLCKDKNILVIVDPKGDNWVKYQGASVITPNMSELSQMIGKKVENLDEDIENAARKIHNKTGIDNLLITRSEKGMTLINEKSFIHMKAEAKEVFDVSGAGDTVVAALAVFLASGQAIKTAVKYANIAAGIVVSKRGTATVTLDEIKNMELLEGITSIQSKVMTWEDLFKQVKKWKQSGESVAVTNGCFDIIHKGHVSCIYQASTFCDRLIVAINTDESIKKLKGELRPINSENDRAFVLASLGCVDAVVIFGEDTPEELLSHILPDVLVKGGEYTIEQVPGRQFAKRVELVNYINGYSTTNIINKSNSYKKGEKAI
jgi:D-beta-D-heptose 7-phosphate kinase/D-beta-D-heptose 1-phosphate adenosyltransferase